MNGAESLVGTLLACGIDTCFANPGTSEMHIVAAMARAEGLRCVLGLHETVVTGAADGYARIAGRPAMTLLHCGPGLANGLANLHNAARARTPVVNCVGDQASHQRPLDPPLTADTAGLARTVSGWVRTAASAETVGLDAAAAVQAARKPPGCVATLILPSDVSWSEGGVVADPLTAAAAVHPGRERVRDIAQVLRRGEATIIVVGQGSLTATGLDDAHRIAAATGAGLFAQTMNARIERGAGRHAIDRVPYPIDAALAAFAGARHVILIGAARPVGFFAYPGKPGSLLPPGATLHILAGPEHDPAAALADLADELGAPSIAAPDLVAPELATQGAVSGVKAAQSLAALLPPQAIVVDESISAGRGFYPATGHAAQHDWLQFTGGAIGNGLPMAVGAAIAAPGRRVICLEGDGSGMYSLQALWSMARERLDVTVVILANRRYAILEGELAAIDPNLGPRSAETVDIGNPDLDWVALARGHGVEAARAEEMSQFNALLARSIATPGPFVIELVV